MLITAVLKRGGTIGGSGQLGAAEVRFKDTGYVYRIAAEHRAILGEGLVVISGPHADYKEDAVFTVELLSLPAETAAWKDPLTFAETLASGRGGYQTIHVE